MENEKNKIQKIINTFKENLSQYAKHCLKIIDKQGKVIPFNFNAAQLLLDKQINEQYEKEDRVRMLILKSRPVSYTHLTLPTNREV